MGEREPAAARDASRYAVRVATAADLPALAHCRERWAAEWADPRSRPEGPDPRFVDALSRWWEDTEGHRHTWLAFDAEAPVGMASLLEHERMPWPHRPSGRWGYVAQVWVEPARRRRGVARALMDELAGWGAARGPERLLVNPSEQSRQFYAASGFEPTVMFRRDLR